MKNCDNLPVIDKYYDLILWYFNHIEKFPRSYKFTLGDELRRTLLHTLTLYVETRYSKRRAPILEHVNIELEKLRYLSRLCHDVKILSGKSFEYAVRCLEEIGKMTGGWLRESKKTRAKKTR